MFVLRHVNRQLRLLRLQFVPAPFLWAVLLLVVSACPAIKASPAKDIISVVSADHKSHPLTSDRATTPITGQLLSDRLATGDYQRTESPSSKSNGRFRRSAFGYERDELDGDLEYFGVRPRLSSAALTDSGGLSSLRKYLASDCVQYEHQIGGRWVDPSAHGAEAGDSTVVKAIPCNHRVKYLDGQWEDMLYAEEPGYVVVRRETASASGPDDTDNAQSMDFIPIRGRKKEPSSATVEGWRHGMHSVQPSARDIGPQTAATRTTATTNGAVVGLQSKRDSRQSSSPRNTLWPVSDGSDNERGKKGRIDKILSREDFLPNRGKKLLLERLNELLTSTRPRQTDQVGALSYPKRGKKTRHFPKSSNSQPKDLVWFTKDDFYPHRGKKLDSNDLIGYVDVEDYGVDEPEDDDANMSLDGVIFGSRGRDSESMGRLNRELLNNLSKQEPRDKLRGRKRSVHDSGASSAHYDNVELRSPSVVALNENNGEDVAPKSIDDDSGAVNAAVEDQRPKPSP